MIYLNWYLQYQNIDYDKVSLIFQSRSTWLHVKAFLTEQTSEHHRANWESKNLYLSPTRFVWQ